MARRGKRIRTTYTIYCVDSVYRTKRITKARKLARLDSALLVEKFVESTNCVAFEVIWRAGENRSQNNELSE